MLDLGTLRVAYAHDWLVGLRGGELVLDRLVQIFGPGPLYTLVANGRPLSPAIDACPVVTSDLQALPGASGPLRRWLLPLMPRAVDRLRVGPCDVLLSTSSCVMKGIAAPPGAVHLCYCHSPARYIWSQRHNYAAGLMGLGLRLVQGPFQRWDRRTAGNVDVFIASSRYIAARIEACFGRAAELIHPPVRTELFTPDPSVPREDFWFVASALEPFKRIDLAVDAANRTGHRLVVAGAGSLDGRLRARAGPSVEFVGSQPAEALREYARRARAFLFPSLEDFGIAPIEAMACGCPVVALRAGGALDTVNETCGAFMDEQTTEAMLDAIDRLPDDPDACRANAERFSEARFDGEIATVVREAVESRA